MNMLWYKSWLDTRWRFLIGLALVICSAAGTVLTYPQIQKLMPLVPSINVGGPLGQQLREAAELARTFRGFVWSNWFRQNLPHLATLFSILLGTAGLMSESHGVLFTLSLPVSRSRLLAVRALSGLGALFVLALFPSLLIPMLAPAIGESYSLPSVFVHGVCAFVAASVFFTFALLLSTVFNDIWRPLLIALGIAILSGLIEPLFHSPGIGFFRVMSGEMWFRSGQLPWGGLLASAAVSAVLYALAARNLARRDF
jgi:hypothetical protein